MQKIQKFFIEFFDKHIVQQIIEKGIVSLPNKYIKVYKTLSRCIDITGKK